MNLSSRLALFFAPVLLIGYVLIAFSTYSAQRSIAIAQAQVQLEALIDPLQSSILERKQSLQQFINSLPSMEQIHSANSDKEVLEKMLRQKASYMGQSLSLVILSDSAEPLFRYRYQAENIAPPHQRVHRSLLNNTHSNWIMDRSIAPAVFILSSQAEIEPENKSIAAGEMRQVETQIAVNADHIARISDRIESIYGAKLDTDTKPLPIDNNAITISREIEPGVFLVMRADDRYLKNLLNPLAQTHIIGFLLLFMLTLMTLTISVRRYVGAPLKRLAADLSDLYGGKISQLKGHKRSDEIGLLARRFQNLHLELAETYEQSRILAEYDPLTSLPNRSSFYIHAEETLRQAALYDHEIRLLYIDLDNYKQVNDKFGHDMGDELLVDFSRRLTRSLHNKFGDGTFFAARLAGDEFAVILPPNTKEIDVKKACQDILNLFDGGYWFARGRFAVTLSIGVASYPNDGNNINELVSNGDIAMYQAKEAGKNQTAIYSQELAAESRYLDDLERELRRANFEEEFHLTYMPIYDSDKKIIACEALLRWDSPQLGEVSPADFVPVAETCGLFVQLDRWVIRNAFSDFRRLRNCFGSDFRLSINLSSAELQSNDILGFIKEQFSFYGIQPSSIELEMTETFAISQHLIDGGLLYRLAELGVHISLDDFGTGFTSMLQLVEYPIERIKLDRTFISSLINSDRQDLLPALVDLCHAQNLLVTAEGIENSDVERIVLNANCDSLQGYHLCKPKTLGEIEVLFKPDTEELA